MAQMATRELGCGKVVGRRISRSKTENSAVLAPMPTAMVSTATTVNPGVLNRERSAKRRSESMGGEGRGIRVAWSAIVLVLLLVLVISGLNQQRMFFRGENDQDYENEKEWIDYSALSA